MKSVPGVEAGHVESDACAGGDCVAGGPGMDIFVLWSCCCGEAAGPRKARVVLVVVGGPNRVVYLIAAHYKFSLGWDPILQFVQPTLSP